MNKSGTQSIPHGSKIKKTRKRKNPAIKITPSVPAIPVKLIIRKATDCPAASSITNSPGSSPYRRTASGALQTESADVTATRRIRPGCQIGRASCRERGQACGEDGELTSEES